MNIYGGGKLLNTFDRVKYRQIKDDEIKSLFGKIKLNTDFSLPDKLIQDFINDGSIAPTFKKCANFNNNDFQHIIIHIKKRKNIKKIPPKPRSKKNKNKMSKIDKNSKMSKMSKMSKPKYTKKLNVNLKQVKKKL
jgi:hypothetical protein